ncbi:hypothetical protein BH18CHL2_BH18CHL2_07430 [soil metagenome]
MARAIWRLLVICAAWSIGAVMVWLVGAGGLGGAVPALFAVGAYVLTGGDDTRGPSRRGPERYWRGRRVDDDPGRRRH